MKLRKKLIKNNILIANYKKEKQEFAEKIRDFQEDVKKYKEKIKAERESLEKILLKSDKVIAFLHNSSIELAKSIGKILHNLLSNVDYDMKDILKKIAVEDISKIHDWIQWFERNEFLKKNKIYRNMNEKLNFYKKLEIPVLQDAFGRISKALKMGEKLAEKGEFSMLNVSQANFINKSVISTNRSMLSNKNESMHMDPYTTNILDELNNEGALINTKRETLQEIASRLMEKINTENLSQMSISSINDSIKKMQSAVGWITRKTTNDLHFYVDHDQNE